MDFPLGSLCLFPGVKGAVCWEQPNNLAKEMQKEGGRGVNTHSAGRYQARLDLLHSAQPFLLYSLPQALCTCTII